jgi:lysophospholipase L1-like esterase
MTKRLFLRAGMIAAMLLGAGGCTSGTESTASGDDALVGEGARPRILALGDSITFGWDPHIAPDPADVVPSRYINYATLVGEALGAAVDNGACPGETSSHFLRADGEDNGCAENRALYDLHTSWGAAPTQLEFALDYLRRAVAAGRPPELVTMSIGGNDLLRVVENCKLPGPLGPACMALRFPFYERAFGENLERLMIAIDATGYHGKMVILTTYAPDYSDLAFRFALERFAGKLRASIEAVRGKLGGLDVRVADGYAVFAEAARAHGDKTCLTGYLIPNPDGTCDGHPSRAGHRALADEVLRVAR